MGKCSSKNEVNIVGIKKYVKADMVCRREMFNCLGDTKNILESNSRTGFNVSKKICLKCSTGSPTLTKIFF